MKSLFSFSAILILSHLLCGCATSNVGSSQGSGSTGYKSEGGGYQREYPATAAPAEGRKAEEEERLWEEILVLDQPEGYYHYLRTYPEGKYREQAIRKLEQVKQELQMQLQQKEQELQELEQAHKKAEEDQKSRQALQILEELLEEVSSGIGDGRTDSVGLGDLSTKGGAPQPPVPEESIFQLPAPKPTNEYDLELQEEIPALSRFQDSLTLGDINDALSAILDGCGYYDKRYFKLEDRNGFVLSTRLERIQEDGTPYDPRFREGDRPLSLDENISFLQYLKKLFISETGYYRILVFAISEVPIPVEKEVKPEQSMGMVRSQVFSDGSPSLPFSAEKEKVSTDFFCKVLVYEFRQDNVNESHVNAFLRFKSNLQAMDHLRGSGFLDQVKKFSRP